MDAKGILIMLAIILLIGGFICILVFVKNAAKNLFFMIVTVSTLFLFIYTLNTLYRAINSTVLPR